MSTFSDLKTLAADLAALDSTELSTKLAGATGWVNLGYFDAVRRLGLNAATFTGAALTSGVAEYDLYTLTGIPKGGAGGMMRLLGLTITGNGYTREPLTEITLDDMDARRASTDTSTGLPTAFCLIGENLLELDPAPDSSMTMGGTYCKRPTAMSADTDTPTVLPDEYHEAPAMWAAWRALRYDQQYDKAREVYAEYMTLIGDAREDRTLFSRRRRPALRASRAAGTRPRNVYWRRMGE